MEHAVAFPLLALSSIAYLHNRRASSPAGPSRPGAPFPNWASNVSFSPASLLAPTTTAELCALLHGMTPRAPGEPVPAASAGLYDRIAPSPAWDKLCAGRSKAPGAGAVAAARSRASFEVPAASMRRQRPDLSKYL